MSLVPIVLLVLAFITAAVLLVIVGRRNAEGVDPLEERLAEYGSVSEIDVNLEEIEMSVPFTERIILPAAQRMAAFTTQFTPAETLEKTQHRLDLAGNPRMLTPAIFWVIRFAGLFGLSMLLFLLFIVTGQRTLFVVLGLFIGALIGYFMPQMWLMSKINRRQDEITKSLPDALDLMSICVNAGLGFDQAMYKVYEKWENELAIAFGRVIQEIQLGKTRREALRTMSEGMGVQDVTTFTGAIIQADQLGVSISKILNIQADQMRIRRRQRAQEKAQQAPIKMVIPMVLFIFPAIWIVLLGPAVVQVFKTFFS
jgi:tight adherence protein C